MFFKGSFSKSLSKASEQRRSAYIREEDSFSYLLNEAGLSRLNLQDTQRVQHAAQEKLRPGLDTFQWLGRSFEQAVSYYPGLMIKRDLNETDALQEIAIPLFEPSVVACIYNFCDTQTVAAYQSPSHRLKTYLEARPVNYTVVEGVDQKKSMSIPFNTYVQLIEDLANQIKSAYLSLLLDDLDGADVKVECPIWVPTGEGIGYLFPFCYVPRPETGFQRMSTQARIEAAKKAVMELE